MIFLTDALQDNNLLATYTGYLHVYPRIIAELGTLLPPQYFSLYIAAAVALIRVALFFLLLGVLGPYAKTWRWGIAAAATVLFIGSGQQEVLGNITNLRWFLDIGATLALLGVFRSWGWRLLGLFFLWGGVLSDPLSLALAPIALWRVITLRGSERILPTLYFPAFLLHVLIIDTDARESALSSFLAVPVEFFSSIVVRVLTVPLLGETGATVGVMTTGALITAVMTLVLVALVFLVSWKQSPLQTRLMACLLFAAAFCFFLATINFANLDAISVSSGVAKVSRYSLMPAVLIPSALLVLLSWAHGSWVTKTVKIAFCSLLIIGSGVDSRGDEWSTRGPEWNRTVSEVSDICSTDTRLTSVTVQITPEGTPKTWTATLPCDWVRN
ncbi:hypothetical protein HD598_000124 [Neomicrococcus aestuarii]|uniref:DUF2029 domain-containing protein n=1 Tax=Neomicrococcus aestuarii TaxID=556325 RepID=A0A7W8TR88_9MICC|nr:hypothetical protein [Neomicrococcus aestuarii]MBB5511437.1 hypothetical protein [Neomicrococcus aestuarii]